MNFESIVKEALNKQDKLNALMSLKARADQKAIPSIYRKYVNSLLDEYSLEQLKSMLAMELRMKDKFNNSRPETINALKYAIAELE